MDNAMSLWDVLSAFVDTLTGHMALTACLLAVTDERAVGRRLKRWPPLLLSPLAATLLSAGLAVSLPWLGMTHYFIVSLAILAMVTLWTRWAWGFGFWRALAAVCMASIFQVADATLSWMLYMEFPVGEGFRFAAAIALHLGAGIAVSLLLYRLRFGKWFRLLLDGETAPRRMALLLFGLESVMEALLRLAGGIQTQFLLLYYLLVTAMAVLMAALVVYLAQRFDAARKIQAQQDVIAQQRLYEQELESIRQEVRAFRHDYKNLLAGLSSQAGDLEGLRRTLSALDAGFDLRLGRKIQASTQIGNLQIPEVRSLLLTKLAAMGERGTACRLETLYPVTAVDMDTWDFVRCLGILVDNAAEAALDTDQPWVEIVLLSQDGRVHLRVSNSYGNRIDPGQMWREGWSTKGEDRGLGLASYRRILEGYPNASSCTSWDRGVFVQELTVEART